MYDSTLSGVAPGLRELLLAQAKFNAGDVTIVVDRANITPVPTAAAWTYAVPFSIQTAAGEIIPFSGNVAATAGESTSGGGTADADDATPAMVMGRGSVNFVGTEHTWANGDTATLTLTYTDGYAVAHTDTWVVTFTTA